MSERTKGVLNGVVTLAIVIAGIAIYDKIVAPRLKSNAKAPEPKAPEKGK